MGLEAYTVRKGLIRREERRVGRYEMVRQSEYNEMKKIYIYIMIM